MAGSSGGGWQCAVSWDRQQWLLWVLVGQQNGWISLARKVGAFQVIPYFTRKGVDLPRNLQDLIHISDKTLKVLEDSNDPAAWQLCKDRDYILDKEDLVHMNALQNLRSCN
jgi:hypothetical protein